MKDTKVTKPVIKVTDDLTPYRLIRVMNEKAYTKKGKSNLKAEKKRIHKELSSRGVTQHGRGHGKEIR